MTPTDRNLLPGSGLIPSVARCRNPFLRVERDEFACACFFRGPDADWWPSVDSGGVESVGLAMATPDSSV